MSSCRESDAPVLVRELGTIDYLEAWQLQRETATARAEGTGPDTLLLLEHPSVYTAGKRTEADERPDDGTPVVDVDRGGKITWQRMGRWRPLPARRVLIPKPGTADQRPLSIPSVRDCVVQAAVKIVLEPIFEADFLPCSFGFSPKRSAHDALQVLIDESWQGKRWVVETDIADCFTAIPHEKLMQAVEE